MSPSSSPIYQAQIIMVSFGALLILIVCSQNCIWNQWQMCA